MFENHMKYGQNSLKVKRILKIKKTVTAGNSQERIKRKLVEKNIDDIKISKMKKVQRGNYEKETTVYKFVLILSLDLIKMH